MSTNLTALVAYDRNFGIAKNGRIPWDLPFDRSILYFLTLDLPVIFGARTIASSDKKLIDREVLVLTHHKKPNLDNMKYFTGMNELDDYIQRFDDVAVGGGQDIYELFSDKINTVIASEISGEFECDRFFPDFKKSTWEETILFEQPVDEFHKYAFRTIRYDRKNS